MKNIFFLLLLFSFSASAQEQTWFADTVDGTRQRFEMKTKTIAQLKDTVYIKIGNYHVAVPKSIFTPSAPGATSWANVEDKPETFPPSAHVTQWTDVQGAPAFLVAADIAGKANAVHTHTTADVTGVKGYSISVQALTSSPADGQTVYFGMLPKAPTTSANTSKTHIREAGTITAVNIYCYSGTAGTNEAWSLYIRINNTTDHLIATVSASASERIFAKSDFAIAVNAGDYFEIKGIQPTWATNPLTTIYGGYVYIK